MPSIYKIILTAAFIWNFIYLFSYMVYEAKQRHFAQIVGICLLLTSAFVLFVLNLTTF